MKKPKFPRLEESYESEIVPRNERLSRATKKLLRQLYLRGLSTGDFQESFRWLFGQDAPLSPSTIVLLKQQWEEEYRQWKGRQLEKEITLHCINRSNEIIVLYFEIKNSVSREAANPHLNYLPCLLGPHDKDSAIESPSLLLIYTTYN